MKYQQPFGVIDPDAPYEDGNRVTGKKGSIPPAAAIEDPQRELVHLIDYAGLAPDGVDKEQVRKAIQALIAAATGGGDVDLYVQMTQARARLPIFPEILTADARMNVSSPGAGTILVPPAVNFQHRGIYPVSTSDYPEIDRTFATLANKTYHLRWSYGGGFSLKDVADSGYNAGASVETSAAFDSSYDDMLVARVVTNASNVATVTNLANKHSLWHWDEYTAPVLDPNSNDSRIDVSMPFNWARTPKLVNFTPTWKLWQDGAQDHDIVLWAPYKTVTKSKIPATRYQSVFSYQSDYTTGLAINFVAAA